MATLANTGLARAAKLLGAVDSVGPFTKIAVGTGTGAEAATDEALETKVADGAAAATYEDTNKCVWTATITGFASSYSLREVGLFAADNTMLLRHLWSVARVVDPGDSITITIKCTTAEAA